MMADSKLVDHRKALRRRNLKAGVIGFGGGGSNCTVRNISSTGASLEVESPLGIPESFILFIETECTERAWRVVWRKAKRIGVTFES